MLSAHHIRNNSEAVPLRNSREDIVNHNCSNQITCDTTSPLSASNLRDSGGTMGDDTPRFLIKIVIDFLLLCCVGFPILFFYLWGTPYKRGFFCDDESLAHPYHDSTVRNYMLYAYGILLPIAIIIITEIIRVRRKGDTKRFRFFGYSLPDWASNAYQNIGIFGFGAAACQLAVDIAKYSIGRLRPHFFDVCGPVMPNNTTCADAINQRRYIVDFSCSKNEENPQRIKEMRLSFPSGHSSFSAYTMIYCAIYLHARLNWEGSKLLKHFLQYLLILIHWYTALSRISDYKHHWSDVLAGALLGATAAIITSRFISDLFDRQKSSLLPTTRYELRTNHVNSNGN